MAKKKTSASRSEEIRRYLSTHPNATPKQIVAGLAEKGVEVSLSLAGVVKYTKRSGAKGTAKRRKSTRSGSASDLSARDLFEAKKLTEMLGGIAETRKALDLLEQLQ